MGVVTHAHAGASPHHEAGLIVSGCALRCEDLTLGYDRHPAVHHLSVDIKLGALLAVVGPNGAGKSTLLRGMTGELSALQGRVRYEDVQPDQVAYLPQISGLERDFPITVREFVAMGLWRREAGLGLGIFNALRGQAKDALEQALCTVGMQDHWHRPIGALSGGQLQRVRFARLLLQDARLLLLDEPYAAIDARTTEDLALIVHSMSGEGRTVVTVLHDLDHVRNYYHEALLLARECVASGPVAQVLTSENLEHAAARMRHSEADDLECDLPSQHA